MLPCYERAAVVAGCVVKKGGKTVVKEKEVMGLVLTLPSSKKLVTSWRLLKLQPGLRRESR